MALVTGNTAEKAEKAVSLLAKSGRKAAFAESCTGGLLASVLTGVSGASAVFDCGVVTYSNEMKEKILGVAHETLCAFGAVSEQTARQMALGIQKLSGADYGISITGIAGPASDSTQKPVGLIYICIACPENAVQVICLRNHFTENIREENRASAVNAALDLLLEKLAET